MLCAKFLNLKSRVIRLILTKKAHLCLGLYCVAKMCWRIPNVTEKKANRAKAAKKIIWVLKTAGVNIKGKERHIGPSETERTKNII